MDKRLFVLLVAVTSSATPLMADEETVGGYTWTYGIDGEEARIYSVTPEPAGAVTIPSLLGGKPMTSIGVSAFSGYTNMTSVTIPTGVTSIGNSAFYDCSALTNVTIPVSVKSIGSSAFRGCGGLAEDGFVVVRNVLFDYVGSDGDVVIPDGVKSIGVRAFYHRRYLLSVTMPDGVTSVGSSAFYGCSSLTNVTFGNGVTSIGGSAFYGCSCLTNVAMPDGVTSIGSSAFYGCSSLTNVVIPGGVKKINASAFKNCSSLTGVAIPDGVRSIGASAFYGCSGLTSVSIPASVTSIGSSAFGKCGGLESVTIPQCVCSSKMKTIFPAAYQSITNVVIVDGVKKTMPVFASATRNCTKEMAWQAHCRRSIIVEPSMMRVVNLIENTPGAEGGVPAHGLAFYVETAEHRILVDAGPSDETLRNAERLGVDLQRVDVAILSHGHYDHSGGLLAFAELNPTVAIYMQRSAGSEYYAFDGPEKGYRYIGIDKAILSLPQVRLLDGDTRIDDEIAVFTVERRKHPLPSTNKRIMKKEGEDYVQDDFAHEQSLYVRSTGASAVISGCAHSGVLNILDEFVRKFGRENLPLVVVSGFHLMWKTGYDGTDIREQEEIARRLMDYPCRFYTCHCTGVEPFARMKDIMGDRLEYIHTGGKIDVR